MKYTFTKLITLLVVSFMLVCLLPFGTVFAEDTYSVNLCVEFTENAVLSRYDVVLYIDGEKYGIYEHGVSFVENTTLTQGKHELKFCKIGDKSVDGKINVDVTGDTSVTCTIQCKNSQVKITDLNVSSSQTNASTVAPEALAASSSDGIPLLLRVDADENLAFSRYDVTLYVDGIPYGTYDHGVAFEETVYVTPGEHTFMFCRANDLSIKGQIEIEITEESLLCCTIHCWNDEVTIRDVKLYEGSDDKEHQIASTTHAAATVKPTKTPKPTQTPTPTTKAYINVQNNEDFASLLKITDTEKESNRIKQFAAAHKGDTIEFDGCVVFLMQHGKYTTRYDVMLATCDYNASPVRGPFCSFIDVSFYDMKVEGADEVSGGMNFHIIGKIVDYNADGNYIELKPVKMEYRK